MLSVIERASVEKGLEAVAREGRVEGGIEPPLNGCQLVRERGASGVIIRQGRIMDMNSITDGAFRAWRASSTGALRCLDGHRRQGLYAQEGVIEI